MNYKGYIVELYSSHMGQQRDFKSKSIVSYIHYGFIYIYQNVAYVIELALSFFFKKKREEIF